MKIQRKCKDTFISDRNQLEKIGNFMVAMVLLKNASIWKS